MRVSLFVSCFLAAASSAAEPPHVEVPKAARAVTLVYDIGESDVYYGELVIQKSSDGSFFMACGWDNGYLGLQQYDGEEKRSVVFAAWNGIDEDHPEKARTAGPVEVVSWSQPGKTNVYGGDKKGAQFMRQVPWTIGETNRFVIRSRRAGDISTYTAWLDKGGANRWEKLATFRGYSAYKDLRGYNSFIEDFRRDHKSAAETRKALFGNIWTRQPNGFWFRATTATFVTSASRFEAAEKVNAGDEEGAFMLSTGGDTVKKVKVGIRVELPAIPLRIPTEPDLPFLSSE